MCSINTVVVGAPPRSCTYACCEGQISFWWSQLQIKTPSHLLEPRRPTEEHRGRRGPIRRRLVVKARDMLRLGVGARNFRSRVIRGPRRVLLPWRKAAELDAARVFSYRMMGDVVIARPWFRRDGHVSRTLGNVDARRRNVSEFSSPFVALVVRLRAGTGVEPSFPAAGGRSDGRAGIQAVRLIPSSRRCRAEFLGGGSPMEQLKGLLAVQGNSVFLEESISISVASLRSTEYTRTVSAGSACTNTGHCCVSILALFPRPGLTCRLRCSSTSRDQVQSRHFP